MFHSIVPSDLQKLLHIIMLINIKIKLPNILENKSTILAQFEFNSIESFMYRHEKWTIKVCSLFLSALCDCGKCFFFVSSMARIMSHVWAETF